MLQKRGEVNFGTDIYHKKRKKMKIASIISTAILLILIIGCSQPSENCADGTVIKEDSKHKEVKTHVQNEQEKNYSIDYFSGKAEISTYELDRARYENVHPGEAVLIFVGEPFLPNEQVKADDWKNNETVRVLKMNRIDRFTTGIYDYSMYTSVFTPVTKYDPQYPLKTTFSSQDWCGQSFMQLNNDEGYLIRQFSYFESEGDTNIRFPYVITEDNLFTLARVGLDLLPTGEFKLLPSFTYLRSSHRELKVYKAKASLDSLQGTVYYNWEIPELKRSVRMEIDSERNNRIKKWTETYPTIFDGKLRTSTYSLKKTIRSSYWKQNGLKDVYLRDSLDLQKWNP